MRSTAGASCCYPPAKKNLDGYLKTEGKDWQAGQATRLPAIPADAGKGMGIYDTLHGFAGGAELSEHLTSEGAKHHGTAGRAYIAHLATIDAVGEARKHIDAFMAAIPDKDKQGQARRVAMRFAILAAALELAQPIHGLTDTTAVIRQCHDDWQAAHGSGKHEDRKIIEQTEDFMQTHGMGNCFAWRRRIGQKRSYLGGPCVYRTKKELSIVRHGEIILYKPDLILSFHPVMTPQFAL